MIQAETDGAVAEEGVVLLREKVGLRGDGLVAAEVEGADRHRRGRERGHQLAVGRVLLLLGRHGVGAEIEKFGAVEAHAVGVMVLHERRLVWLFHVGPQDERHAVERDGRQPRGLEQALLLRALLALDLAVAEKRGLGRIQDDHALVTIDKQGIAGAHLGGEIAQADHGGDLHRARHDDGVAGLAARVGADAERGRAVQAGGVRGRDVVGHHDTLVHQPAESLRGVAEQVGEHALRDVADVAAALAQILVVDGLEGRDVALGDAVETGLDVVVAFFELPQRLRDQRLVLEHEQMRVKDARLVLAEVFLHLAHDLLHLLARHQQGLLETRHLRRLAGLLHLVLRHLDVALDIDEDLTIGYPLRGGDAMQGELGTRDVFFVGHEGKLGMRRTRVLSKRGA